jgi:tRNA 2-thiouridine synthesizing protein E
MSDTQPHTDVNTRTTLTVDGQTVELDNEGFLRHLDDWSPTIAIGIATNERLELTAEHFEIIDLLRTFYADYQISPAMRILVKQVRLQLGKKKGSSLYLLQLFPGSPAKLASKIAGLPKPTHCL